jgi:hypothetical protein
VLDAIGALVMTTAVLTSLIALWSIVPRPRRLFRRPS